MSAWDTSGPAVTAPTKAERAYALKGLQRAARVAHMSVPKASLFCVQIPSQRQQDRTNAIKGR